MSAVRRGFLLVAAGALLLLGLSSSCFNPPLEQKLEILFHEDGSVEVSATTRIRPSWIETTRPGVRSRIDAERDAILHEEDLWSQAMKSLDPKRQRVTHEYEDGLLVAARRQAYSQEPESLERLFALTPVAAHVERHRRRITLDLVAMGFNRATARQERRLAEAMRGFSNAFAGYLKALADLYAHLDKKPRRARACLARALRLEDAVSGVDGHLTANEERLVGLLEEASAPLLEILDIEDGEAYSLDEISGLVHDPFPAPVSVRVTGKVIERSGFVPGGKGAFVIPPVGLWNAVESLQGRWVTPIPAVAMVQAYRRSENSGTELDDSELLETLLSQRRITRRLPDPAEIQAALEEALTPPDLYRLTWRLPKSQTVSGSF